MHQGRF